LCPSAFCPTFPASLFVSPALRRARAAEFLKSLDKLIAVAIVAAMMLLGEKAVLSSAMDEDPGALPERIPALAVKTVAAVLVATLTVACVDLVWSRVLWRRDNRMSKHEVKEKLKLAEATG
jgi:flagellar biosynthetic protein FlhB